jgi:hypothetical protein
MEKRGRQSAAALAIPAPAPVEIVERQQPTPDLAAEEAEVWVAVVDSFPADWFTPATAPVLAQYCRHVCHARRLGDWLQQATSDPELTAKAYDRLLKMQERESRAIAALATKMRISQQATTNHRGNTATAAPGKPWEI